MLENHVLDTWNRHNEILLFLIDNTPAGGTVAEQFAHLDRVRRGWLEFHLTGKLPSIAETRISEVASLDPPSLPVVREQLQESREQIRGLLSDAMRGEAKIRMFGQNPVRFLGYLIAHESHHRGQIILALKQSGLPLPKTVTEDGIWGPWIDG